ncbi:MAG: TAT-variant-translocated molybdopterin oxidoreductase [Rhodothermales bacterium]
MIELPVVDNGCTDSEEPRERFWRSVADLQGDPELREAQSQEFMPGANEAPSGTSRRQFLQIMGASMAMAGLTACRRPVETTLPYTRQPEEIVPGEPLYYATAMPFRGIVRGVLVESHEGRPTKIEGNPQHPLSHGATGVFEQASVLNMYDPDRSGNVLYEGAESTWSDFVAAARQVSDDARVVVLAEPSSSPTLQSVRSQLGERFSNLRWVTYAAEGDDPGRLGLQMVTGRPARPVYRFSEADVIVSLDADFLGPTDVNHVHNTAEFASGRRLETAEDEMSRLYAVESTFSLTGGMADHRRRLRAGEIPAFADALAARLGVGGSAQGDYDGDPFFEALVADLQSAGTRGVVAAGDTQPPEVHALAAGINAALGAVGTTVTYLDTEQEAAGPQSSDLAEVVSDMRDGAVDVLLVVGVNPVYDAPPELEFAEAMAGVGQTIHLGSHLDETGRSARWHIPRAHYLEAWGDGRAYDGTLSVIQPLIAPLYADAKSAVEVVNVLATGSATTGYDLVRDRWSQYLSGDFEAQWRRVLHDGFLPDSGYATVSIDGVSTLDLSGATAAGGEMEVVFHLDPTVLDGSFANNAWMMELPDPTTKIVWDNVALMSPATAERLGVEPRYNKGQYDVDIVEIAAEGRSIRLPAWVQPGLADDSIHLTLGYGRRIETTRPPREARFFDLDHYTDIYADGPLANGVGTNVALLRGADMNPVLSGASVERTGETYTISTTQEHGSMEGRPLVRKATLGEFRESPEFAGEAVPLVQGGEPWEEYPTLWEDRHPTGEPAFQDNRYHQNQWGMVIDLNSCTGCNACIVACNSENNIQMVGKDEVGRGREMHWLRIDRYFVSGDGGTDEPEMVVQPIPCMHCENAPCEQVCPVAATVHSPDGTNQMIYNRCIGTRYCSNNCPYKVRRYNFFNWSKTLPNTVQMAQNPNVTVRFRGVMEKCSYCIQRVRGAQRTANVEDRALEDGEVKTACQQSCPAQAITFGDLNDPTSKVMQAKRNPRRYEMLAELLVKPRTSYLARVTNPNAALAPEAGQEG